MNNSHSVAATAFVDRVLITGTLLVVGYAAYSNYFVQDDGFISLRYAEHWVRGYGPVWYPGSMEFGYTNFLFVALCTVLMAAGFGPVVAAGIVTYSGFALAVLASYSIIYRLTGDIKIAVLCLLAIFTNFTVSSYASGLLETSLQAGFVLATYWTVILYALAPREWHPYAIALLASMALLTRLDSSLLLLPAGVFVLHRLSATRHLIPFLALPTLIVGGFLVFCYLHYGHVIPNPFYAKVDGRIVGEGLRYFKLFLDADNFQLIVFAVAWLAVFIAVGGTKPIRNLSESGMFLAAVALWLAYVIFIGGDFMGFRLMVPVIMFSMLAFFLLAAPFRLYALYSGLVIYAVSSSFTHHQINWIQDASYGSTIESPAALNNRVSQPQTGWANTGKQLNKLFYNGSPDDVSIAVMASGAIPFYAGLPTIDMLGANDRWVAQNGSALSPHAGHRRIAPLEYLSKSGVNLIIRHPTYTCGERLEKGLYPDLPILAIPVGGGCSLIAQYSRAHPDVDALMAGGVIEREFSP